MVVTLDILEQGLSARGGYRRKQLEALLPAHEFTGLGTWSMRKGWKSRILGQNIPKERIEGFLNRKKVETGKLFI